MHHPQVCIPTLADTEDRLRYAQATEALTGLRRNLRTRMMANKLNCKLAASQRAYVRSLALQSQVEMRVQACQRHYNVARSALLALRGPGDWELLLQVLKPEDVRGISEQAITEEEKQGRLAAQRMAGMAEHQNTSNVAVPIDLRQALGEGQRKLSWIWYNVGEGELSDGSGRVKAS